MPHQTDTKGYYGIAGTMDIRQILADNLEQLQARHKDLASTPAIERATAELFGLDALLTVVWFLWFTGTLDNDQAKSYAIALPLATIALRAIWKLARQ